MQREFARGRLKDFPDYVDEIIDLSLVQVRRLNELGKFEVKLGLKGSPRLAVPIEWAVGGVGIGERAAGGVGGCRGRLGAFGFGHIGGILVVCAKTGALSAGVAGMGLNFDIVELGRAAKLIVGCLPFEGMLLRIYSVSLRWGTLGVWRMVV
jgi:hypothetical protein